MTEYNLSMTMQVNASHILVKTEDEAKAIIADIKAGKRFEDLARGKSVCPSGRNGGNLGWFGRGMMVPEFEEACFKGKKGQIVGPVKTQFGYHVIKINEVR